MIDASAPAIVLASGSPRRRELLARLGLRFEVDPPRQEEEAWSSGEAPDAYAGRISAAKAAEVAERRPDALVVAGDTIVVLDGDVLGKPGDAVSARAMPWMTGAMNGLASEPTTTPTVAVALRRSDPATRSPR